jgi:hypothetical protein
VIGPIHETQHGNRHLERFSNSRALFSSVEGGFFFGKKPLDRSGFGV